MKKGVSQSAIWQTQGKTRQGKNAPALIGGDKRGGVANPIKGHDRGAVAFHFHLLPIAVLFVFLKGDCQSWLRSHQHHI
jgi:hypothetical protein